MKPRTLLRLIVSLILSAAFVIGATILEASNSLNPTAWYWAQRQLPVLWAVDAFAVLALVPVVGFASSHNRLLNKSEEAARLRDEHQAQLDIMARNAEHAEDVHSEQAERIQSLQQATDELTRKLEALESDTAARQQAIEAEARQLAEQAFAGLSGQVEANTRHMEAVSLAMQYQRAEIKQLRQGVRAIQRRQSVVDIARLTPQELAALEAEEDEAALRLTGGEGEENIFSNVFSQEQNLITGEARRQHREGAEDLTDTSSALSAPEPASSEVAPREPSSLSGGFAPTMNAQSTIISPLTAYAVAPLPEEQFFDLQADTSADAEPEDRETIGFEQTIKTGIDTGIDQAGTQEETTENFDAAVSSQRHSGAMPPDLLASGMTEEEYQLLTHPIIVPDTPPSAPPSSRRPTLRKWN